MPSQKLSIDLTSEANYDQFVLIADFLEKEWKAHFTNRLSGLDQCYWDFVYQGHRITLHLEHYSGISLFLTDLNETATDEEADVIRHLAASVKKKFRL